MIIVSLLLVLGLVPSVGLGRLSRVATSRSGALIPDAPFDRP